MTQQKPTLLVSGTVIERGGHYLLVQDKTPTAYGKWNLPAGRVDPGETPEQAAIRETKEECGFEVELVRHLLTLNLDASRMEQPDKYDHAELYAYAAKITGGELQFPENEILGARWFSYEDIKAMQAENRVRAPEYVVGAIELARAA